MRYSCPGGVWWVGGGKREGVRWGVKRDVGFKSGYKGLKYGYSGKGYKEGV